MLNRLARKTGRTAQVHFPFLQDMGKSAERTIRSLTGRMYAPDFEGLRQIVGPPDALYLDIGSNRGAAALSIWSVYPQARIVAFEPHPPIVERFGNVITRRGGVLHAVALSDQDGEFPLYVPVYRGVVFDGLASLDEDQAAGWLGPGTLFGFDSRYLEVRQMMCPVSTLDAFELDPFFMKIDVQGREHEVLKGGMNTIKSSQPIIFAETDSLDIERTLSMLSPWRYTAYRFDGQRFHEERSQTNMYFVPNSKSFLLRPEAT
jgi:FkbM family methyltransferase